MFQFIWNLTICCFIPKPIIGNRSREFALHIDPNPANIFTLLDAQDNLAHMAWFNGKHEVLNIEAEAQVELFDRNLMDFLVYPFEAVELGFKYDGLAEAHLNQYLLPVSVGNPVIDYAEQLRRQYGPGTIGFLMESTKKIHEDIKIIGRETGHPRTAEETLTLGNGSCRDLVVLQMAVNRHLGLASRFVSGYLYHGVDGEAHELHAWTEVYIPGAGWLAFDPTLGLMAGTDHVKVSSGAVPGSTLPVRGTFRGTATSTLKTSVLIEKIN